MVFQLLEMSKELKLKCVSLEPHIQVFNDTISNSAWHKKATSSNKMMCKHSLQQHKLYNSDSGIVCSIHRVLSSNGVVYLDQLSGARYCIS